MPPQNPTDRPVTVHYQPPDPDAVDTLADRVTDTCPPDVQTNARINFRGFVHTLVQIHNRYLNQQEK